MGGWENDAEHKVCRESGHRKTATSHRKMALPANMFRVQFNVQSFIAGIAANRFEGSSVRLCVARTRMLVVLLMLLRR